MVVSSDSGASGARVREVIFLGTGTSGVIPNIMCLLEDSPKCKTCALAMTVEGKKNLRRNTSML
ncbi:hypothetical protein LPJ59_006312, partial [Coemansia sp. RSA 2399]